MTNSRFAIIEIHENFNNIVPLSPWRILEQYSCFDGTRTRICKQAYATKDEALEHLNRYFEDGDINDCKRID